MIQAKEGHESDRTRIGTKEGVLWAKRKKQKQGWNVGQNQIKEGQNEPEAKWAGRIGGSGGTQIRAKDIQGAERREIKGRKKSLMNWTQTWQRDWDGKSGVTIRTNGAVHARGSE